MGESPSFSEQNPGNRKPEERAPGGAFETLWLQEASQALSCRVRGESPPPSPLLISWLSFPWAALSENPLLLGQDKRVGRVGAGKLGPHP